MKNKKNTGSALIVTLVIMLFLTILGASSFNASRTSLNMSNNIYSKNIKFQAAEQAIQAVWIDQFSSDQGLSEIVNYDSTDKKTFCWDVDEIKVDDCEDKFLNKDKTITSKSELLVLNGIECLSYGNSDQRSYCYKITGEGNIPVLETKKDTHIQEIQVTVVNVSNNGVYEL